VPPVAETAPRIARRAAITLIVWAALTGVLSAASLDDQVYAVARQLMCPVCAGETVAESDSALAREMKAIIRQKLQAGEPPEHIVRYFVGQFGEGVRAEPRPRGLSLVLYAAPPLALLVGLTIVAVFIRRSRSRGAGRETDAVAPPGGGGSSGADELEP
jgi:cytochrome c-type biogenesis protein CcmH